MRKFLQNILKIQHKIIVFVLIICIILTSAAFPRVMVQANGEVLNETAEVETTDDAAETTDNEVTMDIDGAAAEGTNSAAATDSAAEAEEEVEASDFLSYDPQPSTMTKVQVWIDALAAAGYAASARPHWQYKPDGSLMPGGWRCDFVEDTAYSDGGYWTIFPDIATRNLGDYDIEIYTSDSFIDANRVQWYTAADFADAITFVNTNSTTPYWIVVNVDVTLTAQLSITNTAGVTITSGVDGNPSDITLTWGGADTARHFLIGTGAKLILENITLYGSWNGLITTTNAATGGGGILVGTATSTLIMNSGAVIQNCYSTAGAAVHAYGIFTMNGGEISRNFAKGSSNAGSVFVRDSGIFTMLGGTIQDNSATGSGGGVCLYSGGKMYLGDSSGTSDKIPVISNNTATSKSGGGVFVTGSSSEFVMYGGMISGNTATATTGGGGVYVASGKFTMSGGEISGNVATRGGGVCADGTFTMTKGTISGNKTSSTGNSNHGGGVYYNVSGETLTLDNGCIINDNGAANGGGVYIAQGTLTMNGGEINGNAAGANYYGGGVYVASGAAFNMKGGEVNNNGGVKTVNETSYTGPAYGGGVYVTGASSTFTMSGGEISTNTATAYGGGVYVTGGTFDMSEGVISGNTATTYGGGVFVAAATSTFAMSGGKVSGNTSNSGGGVFVNTKATFTMSEGVISGNTGTTSGGGVYVYSGTFDMSKGVISDNTATTYGGGVYMHSTATFTMGGGTIGGEAANESKYGGGVYVYGGTFELSEGVISSNTGTISGGGVYLTWNGKFTMSGGEVSGNTGTTSGGGVHLNSGTFELSQGMINGNTATEHGGGIYVASNGSVVVTSGSSIIDNSATSGGGIYTEDTTNYGNLQTAGDTRFTGNTASVSVTPPADAANYTNIGFESTSIDSHPLNNYDINVDVMIYIVRLTLDSGVDWEDLGNLAASFTQGSSKQTAIFSEEREEYTGYPLSGSDDGIAVLPSGTWDVTLSLPYGYEYTVSYNELSSGKSITIGSESVIVIEIEVSKTSVPPWGKWIYLFS